MTLILVTPYIIPTSVSMQATYILCFVEIGQTLLKLLNGNQCLTPARPSNDIRQSNNQAFENLVYKKTTLPTEAGVKLTATV